MRVFAIGVMLAVCALFAACSSSGGSTYVGGSGKFLPIPDAFIRHADAGVTVDGGLPPDLATPVALGCAGFLNCINACSSQTCFDNCQQNATPQALALFFAVQDCLDRACTGLDAGNGCDVDPAGVICQQCTTDALSTTCEPELNACFAN